MAVLGAAAGLFALWSTSIGWHLASGRLMLAEGRVLEADPFSFTAQGTPWLDHEWLFQVLVACVDAAAGTAGLIAMRCLITACLGLVLLAIARRSGLPGPAALVLATAALYAARLRFFMRPELLTILIATLVVWIYLDVDLKLVPDPERGLPEQRRRIWGWALALAGLTMLGANLHGGALVIPAMVCGLWIAEAAGSLLGLGPDRSLLAPRALGAVAVLAAPLVNPQGWRLYLVPFSLAHLVGQPYVPNPEWISPSPADLPSLWLAAALGLAALAAAERRPVRWALMLGITALAMRYVRNAGLFFALLPLASAPAIARLGSRLSRVDRPGPTGRLAAALMLSILIASGFVLVSPHPLELRMSAARYPIAAADFMERHQLAGERCYNDVVFGGYLIGRMFPPRQVFLDDRNEVHEPLLEEIYGVLGRSDVAAWQAMLDRYRITTALLRYQEPIEVHAPDGSVLGRRGFSALWFPAPRWALVYWDDTSMLLVRRRPGNASRGQLSNHDQLSSRDQLLDEHEYRVIRPDDTEHLARMLSTGRLTRQQLAAELQRKLEEDGTCRRALDLSELVLGAR